VYQDLPLQPGAGIPLGIPLARKTTAERKKDLEAFASKSLISLLVFGRDGGIRTRYHLHPMELLGEF
jgi:hypothetical protein